MGQIENSNKYDLPERLLQFTIATLDLVEALPNTRVGNHIAGQLVRCGTAGAPNYAEAQGAESRKDFVHKIKIALKEMRETYVWLKVIDRKSLVNKNEKLNNVLTECNELIAIFVASIGTAKKNAN